MGTVVNLNEFRNTSKSMPGTSFVGHHEGSTNRQTGGHVTVSTMEEYRDVTLWLMDQELNPKVTTITQNLKRFTIDHSPSHGYWAEADTMFKACELAVNAWIEDEYPDINT